MVKLLFAIPILAAMAMSLGGCGALVAGAAGGAVAGAVIEHNRRPVPPPVPVPYQRW